MKNLSVIILINGKNSKCLKEVNGLPFLYYTLDRLASYGFQHLIFVSTDKFVYQPESYKGINLEFILDEEGNGVKKALKNIPTNNMILIIDGNFFVDIDWSEFICTFLSNHGNVGIVLNVRDNITSMNIYLTYWATLNKYYSSFSSFLQNAFEEGIVSYLIDSSYIDISTSEEFFKAGDFMKQFD